MPRSKSEMRTVFVCQACGHQTPKWQGQCFDCGSRNSLVEEPTRPVGAEGSSQAHGLFVGDSFDAQLYADVDMANTTRLGSGHGEFDRVLGGGIVPGATVLLGGEPGIGKSTLLLQVAGRFATSVGPVLYATGEESAHQVKDRGQRLGVTNAPLYLLAETCLDRILEEVDRLKPSLLIVDSIQTVFSTKLQSAPGSLGQIRQAANLLLFAAKKRNLPTFLIGHVTKDGSLAGPKVLEHVVDTVLYFEGERHHSHRVVRAIKNRFGAVSELGVFEMTDSGLTEVQNPSRVFLSDRAAGVPGSTVFCSIEGARPILVEIQALVTNGVYGSVRRMTSGVEQQRLSLLLAVMEKRAGLTLSGEDVFVNVAGGLAIHEPALDLALVTAVASGFKNRKVHPETVVFGEIGLGGEVRGVSRAGLRIKEAAQLGFKRCVLPDINLIEGPSGCELVGVSNLEEALGALIE